MKVTIRSCFCSSVFGKIIETFILGLPTIYRQLPKTWDFEHVNEYNYRVFCYHNVSGSIA